MMPRAPQPLLPAPPRLALPPLQHPSPRRRPPGPGRGQRGFTLVELLVAVGVGMALTLAMSLMLVRQESGRRALTSVNDAYTGGAYVAFVLDRTLRSAGSGFTQNWNTGFGCQLLVARAGNQILPRATAFPAPFDDLPQAPRLAPVVVHAGAGAGGSDIIAVMTGSSGLGEAPLRVLPGSATGTGLRVPATVGLRERDLVLIAEGGTTCMVQQVANGFLGGADQQLNFGSTYAANDINGINLSSMGSTDTAWLSPLGNTQGAQPNFAFIGVGDNATLLNFDLLRLDGNDAPVPLADGVADLRVIYGIDSNGDDRIDSWVTPDNAPWNADTLLDGSPNSQQNLKSIQALRVGLLLRTTVPEREAVAPETLTLFGDLPSTVQRTRTLTSDERLLRWRTLEFTVPLRNNILAP